MIKAIICDLDDLLVNSGPLHVKAFERVLAENGCSISMLDADTLGGFYGRRVSDIVDTILKKLPGLKISGREYVEKRDGYFLEYVKSELQTMPGFDEFIERFKTSRYIRCLATSGVRQYVDVVIKKFDLNSFFDSVITGDSVVHGKPHPEIFLKAAESIKTKPENCVVCEDAPHGIEAAKAAHMKCIAVKNPFVTIPLDLSGADVIVDSLAQITKGLLSRF